MFGLESHLRMREPQRREAASDVDLIAAAIARLLPRRAVVQGRPTA